MVSKQIDSSRSLNAEVGRQILDIITAGMYNNPLMVIREFIQNAADSIDDLTLKNNPINETCSISVNIEGQDRSITVVDNGTGISNKEVENKLGSIGNSTKEGKGQRGFRGIGRLGGLGYCDILRFETRAHHKEKVAIVEWDGIKLRELTESREKLNLADTIKRIASIRFRKPSASDSAHFLKVSMLNVHRFHSDVLMSIKKTRDYLSVVAPVPYNPNEGEFQYGKELDEYFSQLPNYKTYNIYVNGEQIYKPYTNNFDTGINTKDEISGIKKIEFLNADTDEIIGLGWFALTSFKSSLPKQLVFRGIRVKHGNIEVGDERFLESIFLEKRFATWHIGEIHLNHNIKPNARRDGFEQTHDYEQFLQKAMMIGKRLSNFCREASLRRCALQRVEADLCNLESITSKHRPVLDIEHHTKVIGDSKNLIKSVNKLSQKYGLCVISDRMRKVEKQIKHFEKKPSFLGDMIDGRKIKNIPQKTLLEDVCKAIVTIHKNTQSIEDTVLKIIEPYLKSN